MNNLEFRSGVIDAGSCVSNAWDLVKQNYWLYFGVTVIAVLIIACVPCVNFFIMGPIGVGVYFVMLRSIRGEPVEFGMMFKGFDKFVPAMIVGIVQTLPGLIWTVTDYALNIARFLSARGGGAGSFYQSSDQIFAGLSILYIVFAGLFWIFSIVWGISFYFALPLMADKDIDAVSALKLSARAAWSNIGGIILLGLLQFLLVIGGVLALCIGILFVMPVLYASIAFAYRQVFPSTDQAFNYTPPPPTVYGSGYGQQF